MIQFLANLVLLTALMKETFLLHSAWDSNFDLLLSDVVIRTKKASSSAGCAL